MHAGVMGLIVDEKKKAIPNRVFMNALRECQQMESANTGQRVHQANKHEGGYVANQDNQYDEDIEQDKVMEQDEDAREDEDMEQDEPEVIEEDEKEQYEVAEDQYDEDGDM